MQKLFLSMFILTLSFSVSAAALAEDREEDQGCGWAVDAKIGTLGIGADLSRSIVPRILNLRIGASYFSYSVDFSEEGIEYGGKLRLGAVPVALDVFPFKNWFRLGGGVVINLNEVKATTSSTGTVTIGDNSYDAQTIGPLEGKIKFNRAAPYFGLGFNNPIKKRGHHLGFFADLGILYHGTPTFALTPSRSIPGLQADIDKEIQSVNDNIKDFKIFPVIQFGLSYHF
jgi:hypothetical protein